MIPWERGKLNLVGAERVPTVLVAHDEDSEPTPAGRHGAATRWAANVLDAHVVVDGLFR